MASKKSERATNKVIRLASTLVGNTTTEDFVLVDCKAFHRLLNAVVEYEKIMAEISGERTAD